MEFCYDYDNVEGEKGGFIPFVSLIVPGLGLKISGLLELYGLGCLLVWLGFVFAVFLHAPAVLFLLLA